MLLLTLLLANTSCVWPGTDGSSKSAAVNAVSAAEERHDYATAYRLALPLAESGDPGAQFGIAHIVYPSVGLLPAAEMERTSKSLYLIWLRRSAYGGWNPALQELASEYRRGDSILPVDQEVSRCFASAVEQHGKIGECQRQELSKGYISSVEQISGCGACGE